MQVTFGQLTGTKNIPGDYASIQAAVTDLNALGVGAGGVTFNVAAGHTETITGVISLTATGTPSNQIIFQKSGGGANPLITANTGTNTPASAIQDGIWNLVGSDYVTINGIDLTDPNSTNPATMEYGYGMFKAAADNGCQNNTIKNCVVTLSRENNATGSGPAIEGSKAINVVNSLVSTQTTAVTPTAASGANSYNTFYSNTLQNCNYGIVLNGYVAATPFDLGDTGNDIGGTSGATGNSILNFGGATSATNQAAAIRTLNQWGANISYNTINNNNGSGVNHVSILRGIYAQSGTSANVTINNNILTIKGGGTTTQVSVIENGTGATAAGNTININNNTITNCTNATTTTGVWYGIYNISASATNLNIQNNIFSNNASNATSGATYQIYNTGACPGVINITNNQLGSHSYPAAVAYTGTMYHIYNSSGTTATTLNIANNNFSALSHTTIGTGTIYFIYNTNSNASLTIGNNTWTNLTLNHSGTEYLMYNSSNTQVALNVNNNSIVTGYTRTAACGTLYIYYAGSSSLPTSTQTFTGNNFSNITGATAGSGTFYMMYNSDGATSPYPKKAIYNNTFSNISYNTTGATYGIYTSYLGDGSTTSGSSIYNNTINNITVSGTCYGIYPTGTVSPTYQPSVYGNTVANITTNGAASSIYGYYMAGGGSGINFYKNKVYGVMANGATGAAYGIYVTSAVLTNYMFFPGMDSPSAKTLFS